MRILIIKPSSLGDVIHALRVVRQMKTAGVGIKVDWVIKRGLEGALKASGLIDQTFIFERGKGLYSFLQLICDIRMTRYDFVLDLQFLLQ